MLPNLESLVLLSLIFGNWNKSKISQARKSKRFSAWQFNAEKTKKNLSLSLWKEILNINLEVSTT